jgi:hypothetical protein
MDRLLGLINVAGLSSAPDALRNPKGLLALLGVVLVVLYGLSVGRTKAMVSLLAIYVAYMLTVLFPFLSRVQAFVPGPFQVLTAIGVFVVLYVATFLLLSHSVMRFRLSMGEISIPQVVVISVVQIGLLTCIALSLLPPDAGIRIVGRLWPFVGTDIALWGWAAASLAILPFMKARRTD